MPATFWVPALRLRSCGPPCRRGKSFAAGPRGHERAHAFRATEFVCAHAEQIRAGGHRGHVQPAESLHGVGVHERLRGAFANEPDDFLERLAYASLVVDEHHRDETHVIRERIRELIEIDDAATVDRDEMPTAGQARRQNRRVLDRAAQDRPRGGCHS